VAIRTEANFAQADVTKYFGLGNETLATEAQIEQGVFDARRRDLRFTAGLDVVLPAGWTAGIAGTIASSALTAGSGSFIDSLLSHGSTRSLNFASAALRLNRDTRSEPLFPVDGTYFSAELEVVPEFLQNRSMATHARVDARSYISIVDISAVLLLRVAAHRVDGTVPWFESASIGGSRSLRGYQRQRYRGDASVVGGMENSGGDDRGVVAPGIRVRSVGGNGTGLPEGRTIRPLAWVRRCRFLDASCECASFGERNTCSLCRRLETVCDIGVRILEIIPKMYLAPTQRPRRKNS
jgi:hypothetical protein